MSRLIVIGAGGHGRTIAEAVMVSGDYVVAGFLDDDFPRLEEALGLPILGIADDFAKWRDHASSAFVAIGNNSLRELLSNRLRQSGFELATVIHPRAYVSPSAVVGQGSAIMAGAIVGTEARIGQGVIVNCGAVVDHHCRVKDFGHLGVNAAMAGGSILGRGGWMQAGSALGYGVSIEEGAVLMPGESVLK